jgi:hypothetical protein
LAPPAFSKTLTFVNNLVRPDATQNTPVLRLLSGIGNIRLSAPGYPPLFPLPSLEKVVRLLAVYFLSTFGKKFASNWNQRSESASNCVQNCTFYRSISGVEASKANCINRVMERAMGIEPTSEAWEASILPLYDARSSVLIVLRN